MFDLIPASFSRFFSSFSFPTFVFPELCLLAIPLGFAYHRWGRTRGITGGLRVALLFVLLLALMGPMLNLGGEGVDIITVVDRSRSLPVDAEGRIHELLQNLFRNRGRGDRVGIVTFGSTPAVERLLTTDGVPGEYTQRVLPDGSDLNEALLAAISLVDPNRPARILVLSDGEANGATPTAAARRAKELGVPIDYREFARPHVGDLAVQSLDLPETVHPLEPFQYSVWVYADKDTEGTVSITRDGKLVSKDKQPRPLQAGMNRLLFRDLLEGGGLHDYEVRVDLPGDPLVENNRGAGVVRVEAGPKLLVLNEDGQPDNFVRALEGGRIPVDVRAAKSFPLSPDSLDPYRAVVVENIPAATFGRVKMERLAQFVEDAGGGLLVTGGERSFGNGGYFKSPLDEVLPVSMEMREEHRKTRLAMAIALDRSGSMTAPVKGGKVKMDLANLGTAECIRLLSPGDSVAVIAVDSSPHTIQGLTNVDDPEPIASKVLKIESTGGGIFVYEALVAAGHELAKAEQATKHIILFSDAADSEEPGDYKRLLDDFEKSGITVSVIGLGSKSDVDAALLEDVAKRGKGNIMFTEDAEELPRLFTQDTMSVARSSFVKKDKMTQPNGIAGQTVPTGQLIAEFVSGNFPNVDGYNLSYLKPDATLGVVSQDEYKAPWAAYWYRGLGRVAAVTVEVDGPHSGEFGKWENYGDFAVTIGRWLLGGGDLQSAYVKMSREGQDAVVSLELDPDRPLKSGADAPTLVVLTPGEEREDALRIPFQWNGPNTLQTRFPLTRSGTYRSVVSVKGIDPIRVPVVTLPYSPEFMPRVGLPTGQATLKAVADLTGGKSRIDVLEVFGDRPRSARMLPLLPWLAILAIILLLVEIAGRRLSLWAKLVEYVTPEGAVAPPPKAASVVRSIKPIVTPVRPQRGSTAPQPTTATTVAQVTPEPAKSNTPTTEDVYGAAKRRARRRLE